MKVKKPHIMVHKRPVFWGVTDLRIERNYGIGGQGELRVRIWPWSKMTVHDWFMQERTNMKMFYSEHVGLMVFADKMNTHGTGEMYSMMQIKMDVVGEGVALVNERFYG